MAICVSCGRKGKLDDGCPYCPGFVFVDFDEFTKAYLTTALWAETDDNENPLDDNYSIEDIEAETLTEMVEDCRRFQEAHSDLITDENVAVKTDHSCEARAGHDFWLTRTGHGAGFWDGDWKEPAATNLDDAAKGFGEYNLTATGNGGKVYKL